MNKISEAEYFSVSEIDQLASPNSITMKEKREFVFFFSPLFLTSLYRRKPSAKAKYMQKAASIDAISVSDDSTPSSRYCLFCIVFR